MGGDGAGITPDQQDGERRVLAVARAKAGKRDIKELDAAAGDGDLWRGALRGAEDGKAVSVQHQVLVDGQGLPEGDIAGESENAAGIGADLCGQVKLKVGIGSAACKCIVLACAGVQVGLVAGGVIVGFLHNAHGAR